MTAAFRWRHRFLQQARQLPGRLEGLVEADETYLLYSCRGQRQLARKARRHGGRASKRGLSQQQVPWSARIALADDVEALRRQRLARTGVQTVH